MLRSNDSALAVEMKCADRFVCVAKGGWCRPWMPVSGWIGPDNGGLCVSVCSRGDIVPKVSALGESEMSPSTRMRTEAA